MSLLSEIQQSLMQEDTNLGPVMLKLQFLASRLGSDLLEEWVKHETTGYPADVPVPDYRKLAVVYKGTFAASPGVIIRNAAIPSYQIAELAGEEWLKEEMRQSMAELDELIRASQNEHTAPIIEKPNLLLVLQGQVYEGYACTSVAAHLSLGALEGIRASVQSRVLDLTLKLEKIPAAAGFIIGSQPAALPEKDTATVNQSVYQTIFNVGPSTQRLSIVGIGKGNADIFVEALMEGGISQADAEALAEIVSAEEPESKEKPFGKQASAWLRRHIGRLAEDTSKEAIMALLTQAASRFYGFLTNT
ncbi:MAG: hypothetical protein OXM87_11955 [Truepera sp.]|nr:hypothetical protein [Truepera sp.]